ncbi:hypothetical protein MYSTI_00421 [Myxococcus stipitatus DSM 14675]|uniref:Lipoprotein n=1 Tax=Myxococcus stipitatus (strain DSM 14675 / JCM 12634 / Mx s8) TaxID=1278073 RepID=L7U2E0_MYXSD|nr:hypothetical protein [Myxococcus stipitatus]AGC41772.1 hypothetical protein MYSTI_00421 [Myxococcus stipitatus DSM 14675]
MSRLSHPALMFALLLASTSALGGSQWVQARTVLNTCGYFSTSQAELTLTYRNDDLPWGTSVFLIYGWGGSGVDWAPAPQTVEAPAVAPYHWGTTVTGVIRARTSTQYTSLNYVWKVVLPDGHEFYEKGNGSTYGYYAADFSQVPMPCTTTAGTFVGTPTSLNITTVVKN